jgi:hypothetical protein
VCDGDNAWVYVSTPTNASKKIYQIGETYYQIHKKNPEWGIDATPRTWKRSVALIENSHRRALQRPPPLVASPQYVDLHPRMRLPSCVPQTPQPIPPSNCERVLLTSIYDEKDELRRRELEEVLRHNLRVFDRVYLIYNEPGTFLNMTQNYNRLNIEFWPRSLGGRYAHELSNNSHSYLYRDFFEYARKITNKMTPVTFVLSNSDIMYTDSVRRLPCFDSVTREARALTRMEISCDWPCAGFGFGVAAGFGCSRSKCNEPRPRSFDGFAFHPHALSELFMQNVDHPQNIKGGENVVAHSFYVTGFNITNACESIDSWHYHCFARNWTSYSKGMSLCSRDAKMLDMQRALNFTNPVDKAKADKVASSACMLVPLCMTVCDVW